MAAALEIAGDLGAIVVVLWIIAALILATILVKLAFKPLYAIADIVDAVVIGSNPVHDALNAAQDAILDALAAARDGSERVLDALWSGLLDALHLTFELFHLLMVGVKDAFVYLWDHALRPLIHFVTDPIADLAAKAEAEVVALTTTVARDFAAAEKYAQDRATAAFDSAEAFTRVEIKAARADAAAAAAEIDARLDGIGTQAEAIAGDIAATPGLVWDDLKTRLDPKSLAEATILGVLGALGIHSLTSATGLDKADCQSNVKQVCHSDSGQLRKLLEGIALLGFAFDFKELVAFAEKLAAEAEALIIKAA